MTKLKNNNPPYIKLKDNARTVMCDMMIALVPLYIMAYFYYGARAIALGIVSVLCCFGLDLLLSFLRVRKINYRDFTSIITGLIIPLFMPASIHYGIVIVADIFAILVAKQVFGGTGNNVFNPAAAGIAFATISFADKIFMYPIPLDAHLPIFSNEIAGLVQAPSAILKFGGIPTTEISDMLFGNFPGPMGATNILVMLSCFAFLLIRRTARPHATVAYLITCAILGGIFSRADMGFFLSSIFELFSGTLLFGGIYLLNEPTTVPTRNISKIIFGVLAGALTILFRHIGAFEQQFVFVILICNSFVGIMDYVTEIYYAKKRSEAKNELNSNQKVS